MAEKRSSSITPKMTPSKLSKPNSPNLNTKSQMTLLYFLKKYSEENFEDEDEDIDFDNLPLDRQTGFKKTEEYKYRHLMVSKRFLTFFFTASHKHQQGVELGLGSYFDIEMFFYWENVRFCLRLGSNSLIIAILRLMNIPKINLFLGEYYEDDRMKEGVEKWIRICMALKKNKTLETIFVQFGDTTQIPSRILADLLSDKMKFAEVINGNVVIFAKPEIKFENIVIIRVGRSSDLAKIFKVKAKRIEFNGDFSLLDLVKFKEFKSNEFIKELEIEIQLYSPKDPKSIESDQNFESELLPKFEEAFKILKGLNNMELELVDRQNKNFEAHYWNEVVQILGQRITNSKKLIEFAQSNGQKIKKILIVGQFRMHKEPEDFCTRIANNLGLTAVDVNRIESSLEHMGVEIRIDQYFYDF